MVLGNFKITAGSKKGQARLPGGQAAIEYMLLLGVVVAIVLVLFKKEYAQRIPGYTNLYYNRIVVGILGQAPRCGDGKCDLSEKEGNGNCRVDC